MATKVLTFDPRIIFDPNLSHELDTVTLSDGTMYIRVSDTPIDVSTVMDMDITGYSNNWVPMDGMHVERDLIEVMEFTSNITGLVVDGMPAVFNVLDTDTAPDLDVVFTRGVWFLFSDNDDTLIAVTSMTYKEDGWFEKLFINEAKPALERCPVSESYKCIDLDTYEILEPPDGPVSNAPYLSVVVFFGIMAGGLDQVVSVSPRFWSDLQSDAPMYIRFTALVGGDATAAVNVYGCSTASLADIGVAQITFRVFMTSLDGTKINSDVVLVYVAPDKVHVNIVNNK